MQNIRWRDIDHEAPGDGQEVLLTFEGTFHVATYNKAEHLFLLRGGRQIHVSEGEMFWLNLIVPNSVKKVKLS